MTLFSVQILRDYVERESATIEIEAETPELALAAARQRVRDDDDGADDTNLEIEFVGDDGWVDPNSYAFEVSDAAATVLLSVDDAAITTAYTALLPDGQRLQFADQASLNAYLSLNKTP